MNLMKPSTHFYSKLKVHAGALEKVYADANHFSEIPDDWNIVVTDVENSTLAVHQGKQQEINLAATGSIVACLNISRDAGIEIPFFFGGDGATLLMPNEILKDCLQALTFHQERCYSTFDFYLRVGYRTVKQMKEQGGSLYITKYQRNNFHIMPLIQGDALQRAENEIKSTGPQDLKLSALKANLLNLNGMECKWDRIPPLDLKNEVLSLIIRACDVNHQHELYSIILKEISSIYGGDAVRNPVSMKRLRMASRLNQFKNEVGLKYATSRFRRLVSSIARSLMGRFYIKFTQKGRDYLKELIQLTETLLIDGSINTVITGSIEKRKRLFELLDHLERNNQIVYGYFSSKTSILSCYVTAIDDYHIHFLDGDQGGYTQASKVIKEKLSVR